MPLSKPGEFLRYFKSVGARVCFHNYLLLLLLVLLLLLFLFFSFILCRRPLVSVNVALKFIYIFFTDKVWI